MSQPQHLWANALSSLPGHAEGLGYGPDSPAAVACTAIDCYLVQFRVVKHRQVDIPLDAFPGLGPLMHEPDETFRGALSSQGFECI